MARTTPGARRQPSSFAMSFRRGYPPSSSSPPSPDSATVHRCRAVRDTIQVGASEGSASGSPAIRGQPAKTSSIPAGVQRSLEWSSPSAWAVRRAAGLSSSPPAKLTVRVSGRAPAAAAAATTAVESTRPTGSSRAGRR